MALYTLLSRSQIHAFAKAFGLGPPRHIKGILEGTVNTYYRLTYADGVSYFLKIDEVGKKARLLNELNVFEALGRISAKLPYLTTLPLKTEAGRLYLPFGKKFVLLFKTIPGKTATPKGLSMKDLATIGKSLALLHKHTIGVKLNPHRFNQAGMEKVFREIKARLDAKHPAVGRLVREKLAFLKKTAPKAVPTGLIHADLFAENILFDGKKLSGIIDFEAGGLGPFLFDVGVCLHALCHPGKNFDGKRMRAFLKGYTGIRPLTRAEKSAFSYYLEQTAMRFLLTRLRDFELKEGKVKAKPFKDYREFVRRFEEIRQLNADFA